MLCGLAFSELGVGGYGVLGGANDEAVTGSSLTAGTVYCGFAFSDTDHPAFSAGGDTRHVVQGCVVSTYWEFGFDIGDIDCVIDNGAKEGGSAEWSDIRCPVGGMLLVLSETN
jgi:hypothetical protein